MFTVEVLCTLAHVGLLAGSIDLVSYPMYMVLPQAARLGVVDRADAGETINLRDAGGFPALDATPSPRILCSYLLDDSPGCNIAFLA